MRLGAFLLAALLAAPASAQVWRWVDAKGTVHYSNAAPPAGARAAKLDIPARPGPDSPDTAECYTLRCQGERMESRLERRELLDTRLAAERLAAAPPPVRGLEFRRYISIQRGMSEGELLGYAGAPDFESRERTQRAWVYLPTPADPFTTTITLVRGRVSEIERVRKF